MQAIDKELEQKEGYESFSVPQQTQQQPVANAWPHPMMQQQQQKQQQQQHPGMLHYAHKCSHTKEIKGLHRYDVNKRSLKKLPRKIFVFRFL